MLTQLKFRAYNDREVTVAVLPRDDYDPAKVVLIVGNQTVKSEWLPTLRSNEVLLWNFAYEIAKSVRDPDNNSTLIGIVKYFNLLSTLLTW